MVSPTPERPLYSVKDWDDIFEVAQSRNIKKSLPWVALPTKHDGKGYRRLMRMDGGPELFCAWVLIVEVAAKCPTRGVLADENGPLDAHDLELKTDCPAELFEKAFKALTSNQIGWVCVEHATSTLEPRSIALEQRSSTLPLRTNERTDKRTNEHGRSIESNDRDDQLILAKAAAVERDVLKNVPCKAKDRSVIRKASLAVATGRIPENWVIDAAAATSAKPRDKPIAFFTSCLKSHCSEGGFDFGKIMSIKIPGAWGATGPPQNGSVEQKPSLKRTDSHVSDDQA